MTEAKEPCRTIRPTWVSVLVLGLLASTWACSDDGTGPAGEEAVPRTGFEERGGIGFTTHAEELTFLDEVGAGSARVTVSQIGSSVQGRPIHLVRLGHPLPPSDEEIAVGQAILIVGSQHGNEPAGREAALQFLRDLAFTEDGELLQALSDATILFIPSGNPDGRIQNTRKNAEGVDVNRDHLELVSPEARAIARALRDLRPDLVVDAHERPKGTTPEVELLWPRNLNVYGPVRTLSRELVEDRLLPELAAAGRSAGLYGPGAGPPGDENEAILRNAVGLRHSLGVLVESAGARPGMERVAVHLEVLRSVLRFQQDRSMEILAAVNSAPAAKAEVGLERSEPFYLFGADNDPPTPHDVLDPPPCAYRLSAEQRIALQPQITLMPLRTEEAGGSEVLLPLDQPLMTLIPLLADGRARDPIVEGLPLVSDVECAALGHPSEAPGLGPHDPSGSPVRQVPTPPVPVSMGGPPVQ